MTELLPRRSNPGGNGSYVAQAQVAALPSPFVIAHRGGGMLSPENTIAAYDTAFNLGVDVIEAGDLYLLSDGGLGAMHDSTVDRTTNGTGNAQAYSTLGWQKLTVDASGWFRGGWTDVGSPPTFGQILTRYGGKAVLMPEAKSSGNSTVDAITKAVIARGLQASVVVQSFNLADATRAAANGCHAMFLSTNGTEVSPATLVAARIEYYGVTTAVTSATVTALHAAGIKVVGWTLDRQATVASMLAKGIDGYFTNQPLYAAGAQNGYKYRVTTAPWTADGVIPHGYISAYDPTGANDTLVGMAGTPGAYRLQPLVAHKSAMLMGWACPLANAAATYTITIPMTFDTADSDVTSWAGAYFGVPDDSVVPPAGADPVVTGWLVAMRQNGQLQLFKATTAGSFVSQGVVSTAAITAGGTATVAIAVTPTTVTVTRTDVGTPNNVAVTDSANRGAYFYLRPNNKNAGQYSFGAVAIT